MRGTIVLGQHALREALRQADALFVTMFIPISFLVVKHRPGRRHHSDVEIVLAKESRPASERDGARCYGAPRHCTQIPRCSLTRPRR